MSEFSDRPLVAGGVVGLRSFRVDKLGRLTGAVYREVWKPGDNEAVCRKGAAYRDLYSFGGTWQYDPDRGVKNPRHRAGDIDCGCGFYAFFDRGKNRWHNRHRVRTVIEGWGVTTVGERGFRCERAKIVAFVAPAWWEFGRFRKSSLPASVRANYPDIPVYRSTRAALKRHPLTFVPPPTPASDDDFWTREIS